VRRAGQSIKAGVLRATQKLKTIGTSSTSASPSVAAPENDDDAQQLEDLHHTEAAPEAAETADAPQPDVAVPAEN
jgi:hypothetical protein